MPATTRVLPPAGWNTSWYLDMNRLARDTSWLHGPAHAYALWAGLSLLAVLVVVAWVSARLRPATPRSLAPVVLTALGALVALALNQLVAQAAGELRPYVTHPHALVLVGRAGDFSFPSDHAVVAGALATGLFFCDRRLGVAAVALAVLVALSRVYVGAHYPGDVVAGLLLGACTAMVCTGGLRAPARRALVVVGRWRLGALLVGD